jgi:TetR/AcrR family transcriptional repressor of nem operon
VLFNTRGVAGASIADVSLATGLEKGGVYNHFETKEALALAAFDYAAELVQGARGAVERESRPLEKLSDDRRLPSRLRKAVRRRRLPAAERRGRCRRHEPTAARRVRRAMDRWRGLVAGLLRDAVAAGDLPPLDVDGLADGTIATLEGGVMLGKLYGTRSIWQRAADHVANHLSLLASQRRPRSLGANFYAIKTDRSSRYRAARRGGIRGAPWAHRRRRHAGGAAANPRRDDRQRRVADDRRQHRRVDRRRHVDHHRVHHR